jgi:predicted DCC family thiol-disulfide oxidoreductase YuxK
MSIHSSNTDRDVVLYDAHCGFCTRSVQQLRNFDGHDRLQFISIHDPIITERYPDLTMAQMMEQMYVIPASDPVRRYGGAAAIRYLSRRLPRLWFAAPFLHIPFSLPLWQLLYRQIATRRYQISARNQSCDQGTCDLHFQNQEQGKR